MRFTFSLPKALWYCACVATLGASSVGCKSREPELTYDMNNELDQFSYAYGLVVAQSMVEQRIDTIRPDVFAQAMRDVFAGSPQMDPQEADGILRAYYTQLESRERERLSRMNQDYLDRNATAEGVTVLPSGLQYKVLTQGSGPKPRVSDRVTVHYEGRLVDGTVFDSSYERGEPATFGLGQVISGWTEIMQHMPVGSKWEVSIPYPMAYGENGRPPQIPPVSTLIFIIELIAIP